VRIARRIASPLLVLAGFALIAAGMYPTFVTYSAAAANWPAVALGTGVFAIGLLVQPAPISRRLTGIGLAVLAVVLFVLGYPLFGVSDGPNLSWFWIPAVMLAATAMIVARGRSWWAALAALGLGIVYVGFGLFLGLGPVGWWPVSIRLPSDLGMWVSTELGAFWPVQVVVFAALIALTMLGAGAIDPGTERDGKLKRDADGTIVR
jgi:hypothetical protein